MSKEPAAQPQPRKATHCTHPDDGTCSMCAPRGEIKVGDWVKIRQDSEYSYEVAVIKQFGHGQMIGIYDEPPSKHVDFWNPTSLHKITSATPRGERSEHVTGASSTDCPRCLEDFGARLGAASSEPRKEERGGPQEKQP